MKINNKKIAAYIRLSKEDGDKEESESITNQKELIKNYVKKNNLGEYEFFIDDGYSGGNFERPEFKRMIGEIEEGNIFIVITKDTSRLGRDFIETSNYMFKYFPEKNVRYIAILENFDTLNPNGVEDIIPFQTIVNDWYLKDISKKIKSVRQNKMKQGLYMGSTVPYGYKRSVENNCKLVVDGYSSKIVKRIFELRLEGITPTMIARKLSEEGIEPPSIYSNKNIKKTYTTNLWGLSTINQILSNPIYIGTLTQRKFDKLNYKSKKKIKLKDEDWIVVKNCVEPIITEKVFNKVQDMKSKQVGKFNKKYDYMLKGLVFCGDCGRKMTVRRRVNKRKKKENKIETYYCCSNNIRYRNGICSLHYFNEEKLKKIVINYLKEILQKYANKSEMKAICNDKYEKMFTFKEFEKEKEMYLKKVETFKMALKNLYIDKTNELISEDEFIDLKKEIENDKNMLLTKISEIEEMIGKNKKEAEEQKNIDKIIEKFLSLENPGKQILMELIKKIEIMENKQVKVYLNFNLNKVNAYGTN